ncbi:hypothetical protein JRQ81_005376 [Phrynocephalus forsythii]|uniref:Uncharacterized protein n=1 Tax=Phrynocephalus forsythii TaxID=171643 RepID=A0A9Q1B6N1_9SAUR|nr:hypothetical protein JRQ81_005376 [Phrynocephalus forsythii]
MGRRPSKTSEPLAARERFRENPTAGAAWLTYQSYLKAIVTGEPLLCVSLATQQAEQCRNPVLSAGVSLFDLDRVGQRGPSQPPPDFQFEKFGSPAGRGKRGERRRLCWPPREETDPSQEVMLRL